MSEPIPESIPTSQDPRSKRPLKRRALTPVTQQANQVTALFAKPDLPIPFPPSTSLAKKPHLPAPPEIVANVQGSSAGAGSGEFHVYKASRRREYERIKMMDEEVERERKDEEFERRREEVRRRDEERTGRNRRRRERKGRGRGKGMGGEMDVDVDVDGEEKVKGKVVGGAMLPLSEKDGGGMHEEVPPASAEGVGVIIHDDD